jgi:hypothetical protein
LKEIVEHESLTILPEDSLLCLILFWIAPIMNIRAKKEFAVFCGFVQMHFEILTFPIWKKKLPFVSASGPNVHDANVVTVASNVIPSGAPSQLVLFAIGSKSMNLP